MRWDKILQKLDIYPTPDSFKVFIASLKTILEYSGESLESLQTWPAPVLPNLKRLEKDEIRFIKSELSKINIPISECQVRVQKLIPQTERKKFAVYYTDDSGVKFMASLACRLLEKLPKSKMVLADPFLGSARTLTAFIEKIGTERLQEVWGIEPLPLPALVAYASLLSVTGGRKDLISVMVGDAFRKIPVALSPFQPELPKADVILTNPPFTRWKYLRKDYRDYLLEVMRRLGYKKYITRREISLQTLSMFLSDYALNEGGVLLSVLPASTFYTIYGRGYKSFLKENYDILALVENKTKPSFSEDSGFKEVILAAIKKPNKHRVTVFAELNDNHEKLIEMIIGEHDIDNNVNAFNLHYLPRFLDINWLSLFGERKLIELVSNILKHGLRNNTLEYWDEILKEKSIIRGIEMYGPEFFFIPNKYWRVLRDHDRFVEIENAENRVRLTLDKEFLIKTLRKPSLYSHVIEVNVNTYMVSIPPVELADLPRDLQNYINWGIKTGTAKPAINAYGKYWFSHVYKQIMSKKPFGHLFIPDKVDLTFKQRGVFMNYSKEEVAASKNFYIVRAKGETSVKPLLAWFNSTIFISTLILLGRKISETWTRFLENDYLELPIINIKALDDDTASELVKSINHILNKPLPPFWNQLGEEYRYKLDLSVLDAIKIENTEKILKELYQILHNRFSI